MADKKTNRKKHPGPIIPDIFGDSNCVAFYPFYSNAEDKIGSYNHTWVGTENYNKGHLDNCANFNKSTYLFYEGAREDVLGIPYTAANVSISIWFKLNSLPPEDEKYSLIFLQVHNIAGDSRHLHRIWLKNTGIDSYADDIINVNWNLNKWYHVVYTLDSNFNFKIYLNSTLKTNAIYEDVASNDSDVYNGNCFGAVKYNNNMITTYADIKIDHVRIFNRTLTTQEIQTLYNE